MINTTRDGTRDKNASRILEGCCRQEGVGVDRDLGDTEEHLLVGSRLFTFCGCLCVSFSNSCARYDITGDEFGITWLLDHDAREHLANDNFEVLCGDFMTLSSVDSENIVKDIALGCFDALVLHEILEIQGTFREAIAWFNMVTIFNGKCVILWNRDLYWRACVCNEDNLVAGKLCNTVKWSDDRFSTLSLACNNCASLNSCAVFDLSFAAVKSEVLSLASFWGNLNDIIATLFPSRDETWNRSDEGLTLWSTSLEKLLNAWKTTGDSTGTRLTGGVLGIERKLSTWLTDGLCSDNTDWFMVSNWLAGRHINTVSLAWNTISTFGSKDALNLDAVDIFVSFELCSHFVADELVCFETILLNSFCAIATVDTICEANASFFGFALVDAEAWIWSFSFNSKDVLRHIDETAS